MTEPTQVVHGPIATGPGHDTIIYSVTLGNGFVVTNPDGFGDDSKDHPPTTKPRPLR
jgi:hypothetical protein